MREAQDATTLMRTRYSAFAAGEIDYLFRTLHPEHDDLAIPESELRESLRRSTRDHKYMGLTILDAAKPDAQGLAHVLFLAKVFENGRNISFVELSAFAHDGTGWRYLSGTSRPAPRQPSEVIALRIANFA
jgi:SEC-C motif domain protein